MRRGGRGCRPEMDIQEKHIRAITNKVAKISGFRPNLLETGIGTQGYIITTDTNL
jgi:hypothetical protein